MAEPSENQLKSKFKFLNRTRKILVDVGHDASKPLTEILHLANVYAAGALVLIMMGSNQKCPRAFVFLVGYLVLSGFFGVSACFNLKKYRRRKREFQGFFHAYNQRYEEYEQALRKAGYVAVAPRVGWEVFPSQTVTNVLLVLIGLAAVFGACVVIGSACP